VSASTSFQEVVEGGFDISYQDKTGSSGDYFSDNFEISGAKITDLQMGLALNTTVGVGIMGIGYRAGESVATADEYPSLIDQLVAQNKINSRAYSLYLDDKETSFGSVLFGGIDTKKFVGTLKVLDTQPDPRSQSTVIRSFIVSMTALSVTSQEGKTTDVSGTSFPISVVLDSGTTISYVPAEVLLKIITELEAVDDRLDSGIIFVDCDWRTTHADVFLSFAFGGSDGPVINVPVSELIRDLRGSTTGLPFENACSLGIKSSSGVYLLGDTFLRSAYVVYDIDNNQIALAQTSFESTDSNVVEIKASNSGIPTLTGLSSGQTKVPSSHFDGTIPSSTAKNSLSTSTSTGTTSVAELSGSSPSTTSTGSSGFSESAANPTTGSSTGTDTGSSTSSSPTTSKNAAVAAMPAFDKSSMIVLAVSVIFAAAGGIGFLA
jgi:hypothetical protein